jgi:hypothetical protein
MHLHLIQIIIGTISHLHLILEYQIVLVGHAIPEIKVLIVQLVQLVLMLALSSQVVLGVYIGREITLGNHVLLGHSSKLFILVGV